MTFYRHYLKASLIPAALFLLFVFFSAVSAQQPGLDESLKAGDPERIVAECLKIAEKDPKSQTAYGVIAQWLEKSTKADVPAVVRFYSLYPEEQLRAGFQPYCSVVSYLTGTGRFEDSAALLDRLQKIVPNTPYYKTAAPYVFSRIGRHSEAASIVGAEIAATTDETALKSLRLRLIDVNVAGGRVKEALDVLQEEMKKYPQDETYKNLVTSISQRSSEFKKTLEILKQSVRDNPKDESAIRNLMNESQMIGDFDAIFEHYQKIYESSPEDINLMTMMAEMNVMAGKSATAETLVKKILEKVPYHSRAYFLKGRLLYDAKDYPGCIDYLKKYVEKFGADSVENQTFHFLALASLRTGNNIDAVKYMEKELAKNTAGGKFLLRELEDALYEEKLFGLGVTIFGGLLEKFPGNPDLMTKLGLFKYYSGDLAGAASVLEKVSGRSQESIIAQYVLGLVSAEGGDVKKARAAFARCARYDLPKIKSMADMDTERTSLVTSPFPYHHVCYIHAALRVGEMKKATAALEDLFRLLLTKAPPKMVEENMKKSDPMGANVRKEYSFFKSLNFYLRNMGAEEMKKISAAPEPAAILAKYLSNPKVRALYDKSFEHQRAGDVENAMQCIIDALEADRGNPFLVLRGASLGVQANSFRVGVLMQKFFSLLSVVPGGESDEERFITAYVKALQLGTMMKLQNKAVGGGGTQARADFGDFNNIMTSLEGDIEKLGNGKFKNLSMILTSQKNFLKGDVMKTTDLIREYIKSDADLSTFIWFIESIGSFMLDGIN